MKTSKILMFVMVAGMSLLSISAQAQSSNVKGQANLIHMELISTEDALVLTGDPAKGIFEGMTSPLSGRTYTNSCTPNNQVIRVQVEQRNGVAFGCEKWPAECFGHVYYKCESSLNLANGSAKARQTNR